MIPKAIEVCRKNIQEHKKELKEFLSSDTQEVEDASANVRQLQEDILRLNIEYEERRLVVLEQGIASSVERALMRVAEDTQLLTTQEALREKEHQLDKASFKQRRLLNSKMDFSFSGLELDTLYTAVENFVNEGRIKLTLDKQIAKATNPDRSGFNPSSIPSLLRQLAQVYMSNTDEEVPYDDVYLVCERYFFSRCDLLFDEIAQDDVVQRKDAVLGERYTEFLGLNQEQLGIRPQFRDEAIIPFCAAITKLQLVSLANTPGDKMVALLATAQAIFTRLQEFSTDLVGADDFATLFIYVIVHSHVPRIYSDFQFMFTYKPEFSDINESDYVLTSLEFALEYLIGMDPGDIPELTSTFAEHIILMPRFNQHLSALFDLVQKDVVINDFSFLLPMEWCQNPKHPSKAVIQRDPGSSITVDAVKLKQLPLQTLNHIEQTLISPSDAWLSCETAITEINGVERKCVATVANRLLAPPSVIFTAGPDLESSILRLEIICSVTNAGWLVNPRDAFDDDSNLLKKLASRFSCTLEKAPEALVQHVKRIQHFLQLLDCWPLFTPLSGSFDSLTLFACKRFRTRYEKYFSDRLMLKPYRLTETFLHPQFHDALYVVSMGLCDRLSVVMNLPAACGTPQMTTALRAFQVRENLPDTGQFTHETTKRLFCSLLDLYTERSSYYAPIPPLPMSLQQSEIDCSESHLSMIRQVQSLRTERKTPSAGTAATGTVEDDMFAIEL
ncbi:hypothetical protein PCE1_004849 [Barthelona sp. PCE]